MATIFTAGQIHTMATHRPTAEAVRVDDGRIICVGTLDECASWGPAEVDRRFDGLVLLPGMIEAHSHSLEGALSGLPHVGYYPRPRPDGRVDPGLKSYDEILDRLRAAQRDLGPDEPLLAVGLDPIFFPHEARLDRRHLDQVSTTRPIAVLHASLHLMAVNTAMLELCGIDADDPTPGIQRDASGQPTGELHESRAMSRVGPAMGAVVAAISSPTGLVDFARLCRNAGVTTVAEMAGPLLTNPAALEPALAVTAEASFPARLVYYNWPCAPGTTCDWEDAAERAVALSSRSTDKLRIGGIKLIADGSIQGGTACLCQPGYYLLEDHAQAQLTAEELSAAVGAFHRRDLQVACHTNGDEATEAFIEAVDAALRTHSWLDHRHAAQHVQLATAAQFRRMARLGMAANIFTNHLWYWGDQHHDQTVGPERANRMWACRSAIDLGISATYHADGGVTPTGQLHTAWCAVNRLTPSGRILGAAEAVTVAEALRAVTVEAAYQLHLDHELGSIEAGKRADFTVLEADPFEVDPLALREVPVWGTVLGGLAYPAERAPA